MHARGESLTLLSGIGPYLNKQIIDWLRDPPELEEATPEIRNNFLTLSEARTLRTKYPERFSEIRGDLQMHTLWSDGSGSVRDMAEAAMSRGYAYIAITDHSKGLKIAGGIDENQLSKQGEEIAAVNEVMRGNAARFRVLRSIELNLSPSGAGDMEQSALDRLDLVLGCFHSALRRKEDQTERYLAALRNPSIHILGHPRGRIYNYRSGLRADWETVFREATRLDKAVEIDAYPDRQDLNLSLLKIAKRCGTRISMGTDAHHPWQLEFIDLALAAALAAKIPPERIVNFMPLKELSAWIEKVRNAEARRTRTNRNDKCSARSADSCRNVAKLTRTRIPSHLRQRPSAN